MEHESRGLLPAHADGRVVELRPLRAEGVKSVPRRRGVLQRTAGDLDHAVQQVDVVAGQLRVRPHHIAYAAHVRFGGAHPTAEWPSAKQVDPRIVQWIHDAHGDREGSLELLDGFAFALSGVTGWWRHATRTRWRRPSDSGAVIHTITTFRAEEWSVAASSGEGGGHDTTFRAGMRW